MDLNDTQAVQKVWNRVCPQEQGPTTGSGCNLDLARVQTALEQARNDSAVYADLACRWRAQSSCLRQLAAQKAEQARQLQAMYYVCSGQCVCRPCRRPAPADCIQELLRQHITQEQGCAATLRQMAQCAAPYACLLEQLARQSDQIACRLLQLLACCLG